MLEQIGPVIGVVIAIFTVIGGLYAGTRVILSFFPKRKRVYANLALTGSSDHGNILTITNGSDVPVMVDYWEVVWMKWTWKGRKPGQVEASQDFDDHGFTLAANTRKVFQFIEGDHFGWGVRMAKHGKLFLRLYLDGSKKPHETMLHDPNG